MEAGDADVVEPLDGVAHHLAADRGFVRDRQIRGARGHDQERACGARRVIPAQKNDTTVLMKGSVGDDFFDRHKGFRRRPRDQQTMSA